jgi:hypothetical protein
VKRLILVARAILLSVVCLGLVWLLGFALFGCTPKAQTADEPCRDMQVRSELQGSLECPHPHHTMEQGHWTTITCRCPRNPERSSP